VVRLAPPFETDVSYNPSMVPVSRGHRGGSERKNGSVGGGCNYANETIQLRYNTGDIA